MFTVCALYQFVSLKDFVVLQNLLLKLLTTLKIKGTILLASEGLNGTISGSKIAIDVVLKFLENDGRFNNLEIKFSYSETIPFKRLKVKLKKEIVTLGVSNIDPLSLKGTYVNPKDWNELINDPDVVLIDSRNNYEYEIGTFKGAINSNTEAFREFPSYTKNYLEQYRGKKLAMFCTGGIRCEKSTAYLKSQGFDEVYHLRGGILKYLEQVDEEQSLWQGECFVFDDRVAVKHRLKQGQYNQCHACRYPITTKDQSHSHYEKGVSCPRCYSSHSHFKLNRYRSREYQIQLAKAKGEAHMGDDAHQLLITKLKQKNLNKKNNITKSFKNTAKFILTI